MNNTKLVSFKPCPRCNGIGKIPCTGKEYHYQLSQEWAESLHGRMVMVPFLRASRATGGDLKGDWIQVPGLAIRYTYPGGWDGIKVYISIDKAPNWGNFNRPSSGYFQEEHDVINGHKLYFLTKGRPQSKDVIPIEFDTVSPELKRLSKLLVIGGSHGHTN